MMKRIIDFYADWCHPCQSMKSVIKELESKYIIEKVNVDTEGEKASRYGVMSIPTFIVMKGNEEVGRLTGIVEKSKIEDLMRD